MIAPVLSLFLFSCSTTQPIDVSTIYRKDMRLKIDGKKQDGGVYVLENKKRYDFKAYFYKDADKFVVASCHRHLVWSYPGDKVEFVYEPDPELEQTADELCPLELGAFDVNGQHSWGYVDFRSTETLAGRLSCNGATNRPVYGVSICQSKTGLIQKIAFDVPVEYVHSKDCPRPRTEDNRTFIIQMGHNKCFYLFQNHHDDFHRLTMFGYDDVMLR